MALFVNALFANMYFHSSLSRDVSLKIAVRISNHKCVCVCVCVCLMYVCDVSFSGYRIEMCCTIRHFINILYSVPARQIGFYDCFKSYFTV